MNSKVDIIHLEHQAAAVEDGVDTPTFRRGTPEEKALVRKLDRRLLPMIWIMYVFNYLDRTNIGNAKVGGMEVDLNLSSSDYSLALSVFFVGYLLNELPSNLLLARSRPSIFLPSLMFVWGAISIGAKGIKDLGGLVALRVFLGLVEAGFFPGVLLLFSCWYRPEELSLRMATLYSASLVSGAFGGLLGGVITDYMNGVANTPGWQWLFIVEGLATCFVSCIAFFVLPDFPATTRWLSQEERELAIARLVSININEDSSLRLSHRQACVAAVKDVKTWILTLILILINGSGTISYFLPTLMTSLGHSARNAQFFTVPIYIVSLVVSLATGYSADRYKSKAIHFVASCAYGTVAFIICATVDNPTVKYAMICFGGAAVWSAVPVFYSYMVTQFQGREKRAASIAIINGCGNLASIYGSFLWPASTAPRYQPGFAATTALLAAGGLVMLWVRYYYGNPSVEFESTSAAQDEKA